MVQRLRGWLWLSLAERYHSLAGAGGAWSETEQERFNKVAASWLQLQKDEIKEIGITVAEILTRLDCNYSELHFKVIRWIYRNPGTTRRDIWIVVHGASVREDSAEADMFKLLIRD